MVNTDREILPTAVHPTHYSVSLTPDLEKFTFVGIVEISVEFKEATDTVVLNANELELQSAQLVNVVGKDEQEFEAKSIDLNREKQTATLTFPSSIPADSAATLKIHFTGILNDQMSGFYRSTYETSTGEKKVLAVTQFESTDARKAFPCWDEPAIKATFDIVLQVPNRLTALSNMNVVSEDKVDGSDLKTVRFAKTPVISTYLVAFAVGEFDFIEAKSSGEKNGSPVICRVYTTPGKSEEGEFALTITTKIIEYFADIFGTPYPLPKMDLLAVPDFEAGAMENWGLVTFRNVLLLWNSQSSSARSKLNVASVVAHELAHQWFGNLVTMEWWSHLWLNEGFATWVGSLAVDHLFPEWEVWNQFVVDEVMSGLDLDALRSSHPIEVDVRDAAEISQIFDAISYSKGGSVIRMLSNYMGLEVFLAGIRRYLKKHKFSNASTADLWAALSEESGLDISQFMTLWTKQVGYPVLTLTEKDETTFTVRQNRYLASGDVSSHEDEKLWWVPLELVTEAGRVEGQSRDQPVLTTREADFAKPSGKFFKLNHRQTGVYRVHYPKAHLAKLATAVREGQLTAATDRISLLSDASALAVSGSGSTADVLALLDSFENEKEYLVWSEVATRLRDISSVWFEQPEEVQKAIERLTARLFSVQVKRLGWEFPAGESYLDSQLRILAISRAGGNGDQEVISEARRRFDLFLHGDASALHPDIRGTVFSLIVKTGTHEDYDAVFKHYQETNIADQKLAALAALGSASDSATIKRTLDLSISDDVRPQDIIYLVRTLGSNRHARYELWEFVQKRYDFLADRYKGSPTIVSSIIKSACSYFSSAAKADEIQAFFDARDHRNVERAVKQSLELVRSHAEWLERAKDEVAAWLEKHVQA